SIHNRKRKPAQEESASTVQVRRRSFRSFGNHVDGMVKLATKSVRRRHTLPPIPQPSFLCFVKSSWKERDCNQTHSSAKRRWRTSAQGTGVTLPASTSAMRRAISADH